MKRITKYSLRALLAMVLACKANAAKPDKDKDKKKNKKGGGGIVYSVPEAGTSFLLGPSWLLSYFHSERLPDLINFWDEFRAAPEFGLAVWLALAVTCSMIWAAYRFIDCRLSGWRDEV